MVKKMNESKIFVYAADAAKLYDEAAFRTAYAGVSAYRQEKTDRFLFRKDKVLSLAAELLLQYALKEQGILSYCVGEEKSGKPYLRECVWEEGRLLARREPQFNLSHSEKRVMCAIADQEVGCDVEKITAMEPEVARQIFTSCEYEKIAACRAGKQQDEMFFRIWTLKESYMKATGLGSALSPDSFSVYPSCSDRGYYFKEYDLSDGYCYAVCGRSDQFDESIRFVDI